MNMDVQEKSIPAVFAWIGGKSRLREKISAFFPEQNIPIRDRNYQNYVEVFGGAAWMMLHKPRWAVNEVYNDYNSELTNLFNVIRHHSNEFMRQFVLLPKSEAIFQFLITNDQLTDIQKAVATYVKYSWSFSSNGKFFSPKPRNRYNFYRKIIVISQRLETVSILNHSFENVIQRYNKSNVFMYLDPPYYDFEYLYEKKFSKDSHVLLRDLLRNFKGKFCLSYNDCPEIRGLYSDFKIVELETTYTSFAAGERKAKELLIMNY